MSIIYEPREIPLGANQQAPVSVRANTITPVSADGSFEIAFGDQGAFKPAYVGVQIDTPGFDRVRVRDTSGKANTVNIIFSGGGVRDQRFTSSTPMEIVDPFSVALSERRVFVRDTVSNTATGEKGLIEFVNPAGSGVLVTVVGLRIAVDLPARVDLFAGSDGNPLSGSPITAYATYLQAGGVTTPAAAFMRTESRPTPAAPANRAGVAAFLLTENAPSQRTLSFQMEPGTVLRAFGQTADANLELGVQWIERPL